MITIRVGPAPPPVQMFPPRVTSAQGDETAVAADVPAGQPPVTMRAHEHGRPAVVLGGVVADHPRLVVMRTAVGGTRMIPMPIGEQVPRIC